MLKRLKRRFIIISMLSVFFVLATTIAAINISNYAVIERNSTSVLTEVINADTNDVPPGILKKPPHERDNPPEEGRLHQNSFFICVYDENGNLNKFNYNHVFQLSEDECKDLSLKVLNNEIKGRKYGYFRFLKEFKDDGFTYVAFVDIKLELDNAKNFLLLSSLISLGAYGIFVGLIVLGSNIAFKPSEEAYKKQKKFITNASHELKTPLTVISADLDLIEMDNGKSEWSESIRNQVERLTNMTKQMVELSRLEEDDASNYPFEDFYLNEVCQKVVKEFEQSFKKEKILFSSNIPEGITMYGNKYLIDDLIHIFLDNSLKYTGGENKTSSFEIKKLSKGKIELKFSNSLNENDEIDVKQIMERFYRSPSNTKEGSGIGLSIAEEIINKHKAKIKVEKINSKISFVITFN